MNDRIRWLDDLGTDSADRTDGLVLVDAYMREGRPPEEVSIIEKAKSYGAYAVFFEAPRNGGQAVPQAFVFLSDGAENDREFGQLHRRLWSWGGVPLVYRKTRGLIQLFRCAHQPDFVSPSGQIICKPVRSLNIAANIAAVDPWWDAARLRNGTIWDDPSVCREMLSASKASHKTLINAVRDLNRGLNEEGLLKKHLRRRLLILSLLIAYLEERGVFLPGYFADFVPGAGKFFQVLANGKGLVNLLEDLEERFNGNVFSFDATDRAALRNSNQLQRFSTFVEGHEDVGGQLTLWQLYSFKDLPVELISHIYQLFVTDADTAVYTPPFLVRLILGEALSWERLDRLEQRDEVILDPACGSGVFLVEAYKRLVLHWRSRHEWRRPRTADLKRLVKKLRGIDLEHGAIELAAFSLCLALCDALEPEEIRASIKLFPPLAGKTLLQGCFFDAKERQVFAEPIGVIIGNPPFESKLNTEGAQRSCARYEAQYGPLPDKQLGYLFLHDSMDMVSEGGVLAMLQQYGFLYNQQSLSFRQNFLKKWNVKEVLDFISVRGLFHKGGADTKVIVVVANASRPTDNEKILHAVFRRSGRIDAEQGFDIDYYDLHWLPRELAIANDAVWRADLLGGGRVISFLDRLKKLPTLGEFAARQGWDFGEGFIEGRRGVSRPAQHIVGKKLLPSEALTVDGIDLSQITTAPQKPIEGQRSEKRFTPPMLLVREHMDLPHAFWTRDYLTYKNKIVGFAAPPAQRELLAAADKWLTTEANALRAFVAGISVRLFTQKATTLSAADILALPFPENGTLDLSPNEKIIAEDIVAYQRDLVRLGDDSLAFGDVSAQALGDFAKVFTERISHIYRRNPLRSLKPQRWPGVLCQPFVFGPGEVDWSGAEELKGRLDSLFREKHGTRLHVVRIARVYDGTFLFILKPDRLRYWLRSVALRDADEALADLRAQGF
jgi:hypothetical protein